MDQVPCLINARDLKFAVIHGEKSQMQRTNIINDFKEGYLRVVIATDVASRGLDVKDMYAILFFSFPRKTW